MRDEKSILPVSHMIHGVYDIDGVALKLKESADSLKKIMETIEL